MNKDVLPGSRPAGVLGRHPLVEDGTAAFEGDSARRFQHVRQTLRRLKEMDDDVQRVDRLLVEELKEADRNTISGAVAVASIAIITPPGEDASTAPSR